MLQSITNNEQIEAKNEQLTAQNKQLTIENEQLTAKNEQLTAKNEQLMIKKLKFENTLINAASHIGAIEKKISELEDMHQIARRQELASTDSTEFPESKQLDSKEDELATTVRKRRRITKRTKVEEE